MAYFVAKELHLRPYDILTTWTCEELLVAYGEYANIKAAESYEARMSMFSKEKPVKPKPDEKYAVLFLTQEELEESYKKPETNEFNLSELVNNMF